MKTTGATSARRIAARLEIRADRAEEMRQTLPLDAAAVVEAGHLWVATLSALRARDGRVKMDAVRVFLVDAEGETDVTGPCLSARDFGLWPTAGTAEGLRRRAAERGGVVLGQGRMAV